MGGNLSNQVGRGAWGEWRGEKWRRDGTGAPEGWLGEGKGSHAWRGKLGNHWEGRGSKGSMTRFPLPTWAPRNLLRSWAWTSAHLGPLQQHRSWWSGREGRGSKSKGWTSRTGTPEGWLGEGRSSYTQRTHPRLGVQWRRGRPWGRWWGQGTKQWKGTQPVLSLST